MTSQNGVFIDRLATELVRIVDALKIENFYMEEQVREHYSVIDE